MDWRENVKRSLPALRQHKRMTQQEVADYLGLKIRAYQEIESTGKITLDNLVKVSDLFGVKFSDIIKEKKDVTFEAVEGLYKVPVVNKIPASGFIESYPEIVVEDFVYTSIKGVDGLVAVKVKGDSMSPRIEDGDIVVLAPDPVFEDGKVYAVIANGSEATLKTVKKIQGGYICIPQNQHFETLFVPEDKLVRLYKVVELVKKF